jgi:hypothetical protein
MKQRAPLLLFTIVLAIIGIVALVFWHSIRTSTVTPLSSLILLVADFLSSIDQIYLWGFLLVVLILGTLSALGRIRPSEAASPTIHEKKTSSGRLRYWETQVYLVTRGRTPSRYAIHEVRRLMVAVMGYKLHLDMAEADRRLKAGELAIPPEFEEFSKLEKEVVESEDLLTEFFKTLVAMLRGTSQQVIQSREKVLLDLVNYLEQQMEIEHDHGH